MNASVEEQLPRGDEGFATLGAVMGPLPSVSKIMAYERGGLGKPLSTAGARKRALACVATQVLCLTTFSFKALGALRTAEGSEAAVAELVSRQLSFSEEGLLTGGAHVRPLTCVGSLMAGQTGQLGEALLTERTVKRLLSAVDQQVPVQGLQLSEALGALGADVRPPPGVDLPVLVQKPYVREALPTLAGERSRTRVLHLVSLEVRGTAVDPVTQGALVLASHHVALSVSQPVQDAAEALATFLTSVPAALLL